MTQSFDSAGAALDAVAENVTELQAAEASDRAAFDSLAADVRAFIAGLPAGTLSVEDSAKADAIIASIDAATAAETTEAADQAALQAEVDAA